jgi:hypothetical protein
MMPPSSRYSLYKGILRKVTQTRDPPKTVKQVPSELRTIFSLLPAQFPQHCSPPKKRAALTAVLEGEDVTVRGVRLRGPGRRRGGAGVAMAGKLYSATAPGPRIRLLQRASVLGTDGSGGTDSIDCTAAMSSRAFTGNRVRWDAGIVS